MTSTTVTTVSTWLLYLLLQLPILQQHCCPVLPSNIALLLMLSWSIFAYFCLPNFSKFNFNFNFKGQRGNWHCLMTIPLVCKVQENTICVLKNCCNIAWRSANASKNPRGLPRFSPKIRKYIFRKLEFFIKISAKF